MSDNISKKSLAAIISHRDSGWILDFSVITNDAVCYGVHEHTKDSVLIFTDGRVEYMDAMEFSNMREWYGE